LNVRIYKWGFVCAGMMGYFYIAALSCYSSLSFLIW
jgi:hypothetical protein